MIHSERTARYILYGAATLLFFFLQSAFLQRLTLWGVMPFLYPILVAVLGMCEGPFGGALYGLILGVICDLTLVAPIPCFYTLIFPLVGLLAGLISQSWLPAGVFCALLVTILAFLLTDAFHCLLLAMTGKAAWVVAGSVSVRETAISLPLALPVFWLFWQVHKKCHMDD